MSKRSGSRARKARKAAIAKAAENVPLQIAGVAFNCNGRKGTTGYSSRSSIDAKALHGRTHHATAWNAPSGGGIDRAGGKTGKGAFKALGVNVKLLRHERDQRDGAAIREAAQAAFERTRKAR
jgi:hypothetical protein